MLGVFAPSMSNGAELCQLAKVHEKAVTARRMPVAGPFNDLPRGKFVAAGGECLSRTYWQDGQKHEQKM